MSPRRLRVSGREFSVALMAVRNASLSRWICRGVVTAALVAFCPAATLAQQPPVVEDLSAPPIPAAGHDYINLLNETVNPQTGAVNVNIKIPTPEGRGFSIPFAVTYNSNQTLMLQQNPNGGLWWQPASAPGATAGAWSYSLPHLSDFVSSYTLDPQDQANGDGSSTCHMVSGFVFTDINGVSHYFDLAYIFDNVAVHTPSIDWDLDTACTAAGFNVALSNGQSGTGPFTIPSNDSDRIYQASLTQIPADTNEIPGPNPPQPQLQATAVIAGPDGTSYTFYAPNCGDGNPNCEGLPVSIEDRNGNLVTFGNSVVDTGGRNIVSTGWNTTVPTNTIITGADGQAYTLAWSTVSYSGYNVPSIGLTAGRSPCPSNVNGGFPTGSRSNQMITKITLPNGRYYSFTYDPIYGTVQQITNPNGGYTRYTYGTEPVYGQVGAAWGQGYCLFKVQRVMVTSREVGIIDPSSGTRVPLQTQSFSYTDTSNNDPQTTTITTTDVVRGTSSNTTHRYTNGDVTIPAETITYNDSNGVTLKTVTKSWLDPSSLTCEVETIGSSGSSRGTIYGYTRGDILIDKKEYDYGQITPSACSSSSNGGSTEFGAVTIPSGLPARETSYTFQSFGPTNYLVPSLLNKPCKVVTNDSNGNQAAETDIYYDGSTGLCGTPSTPSTSAVGSLPAGTHDETLYGSSATTSRGNITAITRKCFGCTDSTTRYSYDETGQITSITDPNSNVTTVSHTDSPTHYANGTTVNTNAYVTRIDPPHGTGNVSLATTYSYDYNTGNVLSVTDPNGQTTTYQYSDPLNRLTEVDHPNQDPSGNHAKIGYCYTDVGGSYPGGTCTSNSASFQVFAGTIATPDPTVTSYTTYDGLGRAIEAGLTSAPGGTIKTSTTYDGLGRVLSATNPSQSGSSVSTGYAYDSLGRKISEREQDSNVKYWCYDGLSNAAWSGCPGTTISNTEWVNSQDESGHLAQHVSDGLGRLVTVFEQSPRENSLGLQTNYTYDALDDLTNVNQVGVSGEVARTRRFAYDSLSRLLAAYNPENTGTSLPAQLNCGVGGSWTTCYTYYSNGNLQTKTDNRNVTISYSYDSLNRLSAKTYSSSGSLLSCYSYDTAANGKGMLAAEWTTASSCSSTSGYQSMRTILSYDAMGRVLNEQQCVLSFCTTGVSSPPCQTGTATGISYCYNLAGQLRSLSNGLGALTFTSMYNSAGWLSSLTSNLVDPTHPQNLFTTDPASGYTPSGQIQNFSLGDHISVSRTYDERLRPKTETALGQ